MEKWTEKLYMDLCKNEDSACVFNEDKEKGIQVLVDRVCESDRELILERYKLDMSFREMGDINGCSKQNVHKKMERILADILKDKCAGMIKGYEQFLMTGVDRCGLSKKVWGPLVRNGCLTLENLRDMGVVKARKIRGIGNGGVDEIMREVGWLWG